MTLPRSSELKAFACRLCLFCSFQALVLAGLWLHFDQDAEANYLAATIDKHRRLAKTTPPRILLAGGSNAALGFDSERLEALTGLPVVNMGLAVHLGLDFILNELEGSIRPGDFIVLSPEYELLSGEYQLSSLQQLITYRPASIRFLAPLQASQLASDHALPLFCEFVRRSIYVNPITSRQRTAQQFPYSRAGFNPHGDFIAHHDLPSTNLPPSEPSASEPTLNSQWIPHPAMLERLQSFAQFCHHRRVRLFLSFPPRPAEDWDSEKTAAQLAHDQLSQIPLLTLLDKPIDNLQPRSRFFDSKYHLDQEGASLRTERLIQALQRL